MINKLEIGNICIMQNGKVVNQKTYRWSTLKKPEIKFTLLVIDSKIISLSLKHINNNKTVRKLKVNSKQLENVLTELEKIIKTELFIYIKSTYVTMYRQKRHYPKLYKQNFNKERKKLIKV